MREHKELLDVTAVELHRRVPLSWFNNDMEKRDYWIIEFATLVVENMDGEKRRVKR